MLSAHRLYKVLMDRYTTDGTAKLLDVFNDFYSHILDFSVIKPEDKQELLTFDLPDYIVKCFDEHMSAYSLKLMISTIGNHDNEVAHKLQDIFKSTENQTIKKFIKLLLVDISAIFDKSAKDHEQTGLGDEVFEITILNTINKINETNDLILTGEHCLLNFITLHADKLTLEADVSESFNDFINNLKFKYDLLHQDKTTGYTIDSFTDAMIALNKLVDVHDVMNVSLEIRSIKEKINGKQFKGGNPNMSDDTIIDIFAGNYNKVPEGYPQATVPYPSFITNTEAFNKITDKQRKMEIYGFLADNRQRFNEILKNAIGIVMSHLGQELPPERIARALNEVLNVRVTDGIIRDTIHVIKFLRECYPAAISGGPRNALEFIIHTYIPALKYFKSSIMETYPEIYRGILDKFVTDRTMNIVGIIDRLDRGTSITPISFKREGGIRFNSKSIYQPNQPQAPQTPPPSYTSDVMFGGITGGDGEETVDTSSSSASTAKSYVDALVYGQKAFNRAYEVIYRKLIGAINEINIQNVHSATYNKYYAMCGIFEAIAIRNAETTTYLSGFYGEKNYNRLYTKAVDTAIKGIAESGISGLNNVSSVLSELKELLEKSSKQANDLRAKFCTSTKSVSELLIAATDGIKQPCMLTNKDFIAMQDAIKHLQNKVLGYTSAVNVKDSKTNVEAYISDSNERNKVINQHYTSEVNAVKQLFNTIESGNSQIDQQACAVWCSIINQKREAMIYLNSVVDTELSKERLKQIESVDLTKDQINAIEHTIIAFKNTKTSDDYKRKLKKLAECLDKSNVANTMKILKHLRKLVDMTGYAEFIALLHRELGIMPREFDWNKFKTQLTNLIVFSSLRVRKIVKRGTINEDTDTFFHNFAKKFEEYIASVQIKDGDKLAKWTNAGYNMLMDFFRATVTKSLPTAADINDALYSTCDEDAPTVDFNIQLSGQFDPSKADALTFNTTNGKEIHNIKTRAADAGKNFINRVCNHYVAYHASHHDDSTIPVYIHNLPVFSVLLEGAIVQGNLEKFLPTAGSDKLLVDNIGYNISLGQKADELDIANATLDAMFSNLFTMIDKYWQLRYSGNLDIPLNITQVLRGGDADKVEGGNIFDSLKLHDPTVGQIIAEATPFYVCAFHTCYHYINKFTHKKTSELDVGEFIMKVPKVSILRPVYKVFKKYKADLKSITQQQLRTCVAVFNEIWMQTTGADDARLSRSIDLLFNELNGCFIFTSELQYNIMKVTKNITKASVDIINNRINDLVAKMSETIEDAIIISGEPLEAQDKAMEDILKTAYNRVKDEKEIQRLSTLKAILSEQNSSNELTEYFKFMELVVTPMLISNQAYGYLFNLFETIKTEGNGFSINLSDYMMSYTVPDPSAGFKCNICSVWDMIQLIRNNQHYDYKRFLFDHPAVVLYNRTQLNVALHNMHNTGTFQMPKWWLVMDENTYPTSPTFAGVGGESGDMKNGVIQLMRQIWPTVDGKTVADYYNQCITEYIADYDHFVHNFLSYPGISDKVIKEVAKVAHDIMKLETAQIPGKDKSQPTAYHMAGYDDINTYADKLSGIYINKSNVHISPPPYSTSEFLPSVGNGGNIISSITLANSPATSNLSVRIGDTNVYANSTGGNIFSDATSCSYSWLDWVIYQLARCDRINYCLPYKLVQMLRDYSNFARYLRPAAMNSRTSEIKYTTSSTGEYDNVVTQNILLRSESDINRSTSEWVGLNQSWLSALIANIPYIINMVNTAAQSMSRDVVYQGVNVSNLLGDISSLLTIVYDDMSNFAPFMPFMCDTTGANVKSVQPFAKLLKLITEGNLIDMQPSDFTKIEWANMHFFNIDGITFPDYRSRDRFEWVKEYAADKLGGSLFGSMLETTIQTLGRNVWAGLIAKTLINARTMTVSSKVDELVCRVINTMSECDINIINSYVNGMLREIFASDSRSLSLTGGYNENDYQLTEQEIPPFVARALSGIIDIKSISGKITSEPEVEQSYLQKTAYNLSIKSSPIGYKANPKHEDVVDAIADNNKTMLTRFATEAIRAGVQLPAKYQTVITIPNANVDCGRPATGTYEIMTLAATHDATDLYKQIKANSLITIYNTSSPFGKLLNIENINIQTRNAFVAAVQGVINGIFTDTAHLSPSFYDINPTGSSAATQYHTVGAAAAYVAVNSLASYVARWDCGDIAAAQNGVRLQSTIADNSVIRPHMLTKYCGTQAEHEQLGAELYGLYKSNDNIANYMNRIPGLKELINYIDAVYVPYIGADDVATKCLGINPQPFLATAGYNTNQTWRALTDPVERLKVVVTMIYNGGRGKTIFAGGTNHDYVLLIAAIIHKFNGNADQQFGALVPNNDIDMDGDKAKPADIGGTGKDAATVTAMDTLLTTHIIKPMFKKLSKLVLDFENNVIGGVIGSQEYQMATTLETVYLNRAQNVLHTVAGNNMSKALAPIHAQLAAGFINYVNDIGAITFDISKPSHEYIRSKLQLLRDKLAHPVFSNEDVSQEIQAAAGGLLLAQTCNYTGSLPVIDIAVMADYTAACKEPLLVTKLALYALGAIYGKQLNEINKLNTKDIDSEAKAANYAKKFTEILYAIAPKTSYKGYVTLTGGKRLHGGEDPVNIKGILDLSARYEEYSALFIGYAYALSRFIRTRAIYYNKLPNKNVTKYSDAGVPTILTDASTTLYKYLYHPESVVCNNANKLAVAVNTVADKRLYIVDPINDNTSSLEKVKEPDATEYPFDIIDVDKFVKSLVSMMTTDIPSTQTLEYKDNMKVNVDAIYNIVKVDATKFYNLLTASPAALSTFSPTNYASGVLSILVADMGKAGVADFFAGGESKDGDKFINDILAQIIRLSVTGNLSAALAARNQPLGTNFSKNADLSNVIEILKKPNVNVANFDSATTDSPLSKLCAVLRSAINQVFFEHMSVKNHADNLKYNNKDLTSQFAPRDVDFAKLPITPPKLPGYIRNVQPTVHNISFDEDMFKYIPFNAPNKAYVYSPQKDIYNATLVSKQSVTAPTLIYKLAGGFDYTFISPGNVQLMLRGMGKPRCHTADPGNWEDECALSSTGNVTVNTELKELLNKLASTNINSIFGKNDIAARANFGFKALNNTVGNELAKVRDGPLGTMDFINLNNSLNGTDPVVVLSSAYKDTTAGKALYSMIFRNRFENDKYDDPQHNYIFGLIVNYFHKHNISFNAIYNSICYPSILFGAAAIRSSINRISKMMTRFGDYMTSKDQSRRSIDYQLINAFLGSISNGSRTLLDYSGYKTQISFFEDISLENIDSFRKNNMLITDVIKGVESRGPNKNYRLLYTANQYTTPSLANTLFSELVQYMTIRTLNTDKKDYEPLQKLFASGVADSIRHFNSLASTLYVMFLLLRQTSYYDNQYDTDRTFINTENPEPFAI